MKLKIPKVKQKKEFKSISSRSLVIKLKKGYILSKRKEKAEETKKVYVPENLVIPSYPYGYPPGRGGPEVETLKGVEVKVEGIEIPVKFKTVGKAIKFEEERESMRFIDMRYPLIPHSPKKGETVFAYAHIKWHKKEGGVVYELIEPSISEKDKENIEKIKRDLEEKLDIDFTKLGTIQAKNILREEIEKAFSLLKDLSESKKRTLLYYIEKDIIGLGKIEPFINDPNIEDISCDGIKIPIYVYHRDPRFASLKTNIMFNDKDELDSFVMKIAQKCNKTISIAEPLMDAALPDGSRVQATLGTDIARKGSNFTIRKFTEKPLTPTHMLKFGTLNSTQLAYLWLAIDNGQSILVSGGTATGKTSLLNALSLFIRPNMKVVSIEDTAELRLPLPHWIPHVARTPLSIKGGVGEVTLFDLLKTSLRQRPDYIIVGEVRGREAFVLFQQMASIPGEESAFVINNNNLKRIPISKVDATKTTGVPTFNPETGKIEIGSLKEKVIHPPVRELYEITTQTGREIITTGNHSVFNSNEEAGVVSELKEGDNILIPATIPCSYNDIDYLNLLELPGIRVYSPKLIKKASRILGFEKASQIAGFTTISNYYGVNNCALPARSFLKLMKEACIDYNPDDVKVRFERRSTSMPAKLNITPELLRLIGYQISEGSLNKARKNNRISLYNNNREILKDMRNCIFKVSGKKSKERITKGFGKSIELSYSNKVIFEFLKKHTGSKGENKKIPDFIFGLSKEKIGHLLSGLYSGDSHICNNYFGYYTISKQLANDISLLLLTLGIVATIRKRKRKGRKNTDYEIIFYKRKEMDIFLKYVKPIGKKIKITKKARERLPETDVYTDKIKKINKINLKKPVPVYDLSVPGTQNFIGGFGGVLLHNTGHPSLATIHAASIPQLIDRLITPPISLPPTLLENIDIIVFLTLARLKSSYVRRSENILEVIGIKDERPVTNKVFEWKPVVDTFESAEKSVILRNIAKRLGLTEESMQDELIRRKRILEWMMEREIFDYREVARVINTYYSDPEKLMDIITEV